MSDERTVNERIASMQPLDDTQIELWLEEEDKIDAIARELARNEDPVTLYPLCGWMQGWCTNTEEGGCMHDSSPKLGCNFFVIEHPEYGVSFKDMKGEK